MRQELHQQYKAVAEGCIECGLCQKDCLFLKQYGSPKEIAERGLESEELFRESFACSLCSLCTAVCPKDIDPALMFHALRAEGRSAGHGEFTEHKGILAYERWGISSFFSWYGLPQECDTVFFPGCAMLGSRSRRVRQIYEHLRQSIPTLGLVLDCCTKPSHDLGRAEFFEKTFGAMRKSLTASGVQTVLVACPSCYRVWQDYGEDITVRTIYEQFAESGVPEKGRFAETVTIHDPCAIRSETKIHRTVRELVAGMGIEISEMKHHGRRTVCCGEGGAACYTVPGFAANWTKIRAQESGDKHILTYCAGCTNFLGRLCRTDHVTDFLFEPERTLAGKIRVTRSPMTWLKRLLLKRILPRIVQPALIGRRDRHAQVVMVKQ
ncbi:MAG: (Fe-S)-binding protein [Desulfobulbaceae bacterium]|nr:(Fe-S)-binding protein [Desulfobulbaceae bacterium]